MKLQIYIQNIDTGVILDISSITNNVSIEQDIDGKAGVLSLLIQKDPHEKSELLNGNIISLVVNGTGIFFGKIFTLGTDASETYKITAYDQKRYLDNQDIVITQNMTSSQIFEYMCNKFSLNSKVKTTTNSIVPKYIHDKKTIYNIIKHGIDHSKIYEGLWCFVRDDFGTLVYTDVESERTDIIVGDKSLLMSYKYEISIDEDTVNHVRVVRNNYETGKRDNWITEDSENIRRWGRLGTLLEADELDSEEQIKQLSKNYLQLKNRETKSMKLVCLGDVRLKAGSGIILKIEKLNILESMWIKNVKNTFENDLHVCNLELEIL
jgi:hypothetical protein